MLTKNLLRFRRRDDSVHPTFLSPRHEGWRELADSLISVMREAVGCTQEEIEERASGIIEASGQNIQVGRGFLKLLLDRMDLAEPSSEEAVELRRKVFEASSRLLAEDAPLASVSHFAEAITVATGRTPELLRVLLYSDLPSQSRARQFHDISSEALIHRYNVAQVQGLLLTAQSVVVRLPANNTAGLRRVFKALRFRQLVARLRKHEDGNMEIEVEGPLSIFVQTQKYGLALASFFPVLLAERKWELLAVVAPKDAGKLMLKLSEVSGLKGADPHFSAYIPEEFEAFTKRFRETTAGWQLAAAEDFLPVPGEVPCFPDYSLENDKGEKIFMELFHPWHSAPLRARLAQIEKQRLPLLLAVSRKCVKENGLESELKASQTFSRHGLLFREMPLPDEVVKKAEGLVKKSTEEKRLE